MRCPVCKTECEQSNICPECGFSEVGKVFINQEEATQWMNSVVSPYRDKYHKANVLPPVEWSEVFKKNAQAKQLFEFSIPAAKKRRNKLELLKDPGNEEYIEYLKDATLGHIAIVSKSDMIRKQFLNVVKETYLTNTNFKRTNSRAIERASDLAAILTGLQPGEVLIYEVCSKIKKDITKLFCTALRDFRIDVTIGKGHGERIICLDLPPFTTIFVAETVDDIPFEIASVLDAVVELDLSQDDLTDLQIREIALLYDIQLTAANINIIKEYSSQKIFQSAKRVLKFISDYLYLHTELQQPLSAEVMREIIKSIC